MAPRAGAAAAAGVPSDVAECGIDASASVMTEVWYHLHNIADTEKHS